MQSDCLRNRWRIPLAVECMLKQVVCYLKGVTGCGLAFHVPMIGNRIVTRGAAARSRTFLGRRLVSRPPDKAECLVSRAGIQRTRCGNELEDPKVRKPLSSCESEYGAYVSGLCHLIYVSNAIAFCLGKPILRCTYIDSTSAKALVTRQGVGRTRHLDGKLLWVQERARDNYMSISGINTFRNFADVGTKALARERILCLLYFLYVVDCNDSHSCVRLSEHSEMESKLAVKLQVRRPQHRAALAAQKTVLAQALRVAVVLNELNLADALSPSISPILE